MATTATPIFPQTPLCEVAPLTTALTARTSLTTPWTGTVVLAAASTNGKRIDAITVKTSATSAAGTVFIWIMDGTTAHLFDEIIVNAVTGSATLPSDGTTKTYTNFVLPATYTLRASTTITQNVNVFCFSGAY